MWQRIGIVVGMIVVVVGWSFAVAQESSQKVYLPVVLNPPGPPPRLERVVLQRSDLSTTFSPSQSRFISNEEEASAHPSPAEALAAFEQQGRETSYYVAFSSATTGVLAVSDKVARYETAEGALAGQEFTQRVEQGRGYTQIDMPELFERTVGLRRVIQDQSTPGGQLVQYMVLIQRGRYLATVMVVGREGGFTSDDAVAFARKAAARLTDGPQPPATPTVTVTS